MTKKVYSQYLKRKYFQARHKILLCCFGFILGVATQPIFAFDFLSIYVASLVFLTFLVLWWHNKFARVLILVLLSLFLGMIRFQSSKPIIDQNHILFYNKQKVVLIGVVSKEPDQRINKINLTVNSKWLMSGQDKRKVKGKVLVTTRLYPRFQYGDKLQLRCTLKEPQPFDDFSYDRYLARYDIYSLCFYPSITRVHTDAANTFFKKVFILKEKLQLSIDKSLPEPSASILSAIVLGSRRNIPTNILEHFRIAGIAHLIAISGMHISLIINMLSLSAPHFYVSRKIAFYYITFFLIIYLTMIGFPVSAIRASIMGWIILLAYQLGRQDSSLHSLIIVATLMVFHNPKILRDDIGFQLSFTAMLGIIHFYPIISKWMEKIPSFFSAKDALMLTLSAQITVLPLLIYYFNAVSLSSFIVNVIVVPLLPFILVLTFLSLVITSFIGSLSWIVFTPLFLLLDYIVDIARFFAKFSYSSFHVQVSFMYVVFMYLIIYLMYKFLTSKLSR